MKVVVILHSSKVIVHSFTSVYGDVNRDAGVDIFDIMCVLDGFVGRFDNCSAENVDLAAASGQCERDGVIDIFDILAVLDAFVAGN